MKNRPILRHLGITLLSLCLLPIFSGCETLAQQRARTAMRQREDMLVVQENTQRRTARIETLEFEIDALRRELDRVRQDTLRATEMEVDALGVQIDAVDQRVNALENHREKDRKEIVDTLSKKMAGIMKQSGGSSSRSSGRRSEYGYEHTVTSGQTLSEISSAYGVSVKVIMEENNITNPNQLRVGQVLFIPE